MKNAISNQNMQTMNFEISDDSGFLGIIDANSYSGYISDEWNYDELLKKLTIEMNKHVIFVWSTGKESIWNIEAHEGFSNSYGMSEIRGNIKASSDWLHFVNYETLSMAAQFSDVNLPENHLQDLRIPTEIGLYEFKIIYLGGNQIRVEYEKSNEIKHKFSSIPFMRS